MLLDSIFRNVNVILLCITNTPTMLYAACSEKLIERSGTQPPHSEFSGSAPVSWTIVYFLVDMYYIYSCMYKK